MAQYNTLGGDNIALDYRLYIEGIQVPFESASISSVYRELPTAQITIPPYKGMELLGKDYFPKVQIFYKDPNQSVPRFSQAQDSELSAMGFSSDYIEQLTNDQKLEILERKAYKLIFNGVINGVSETKMLSDGMGEQRISLNCIHPYYLLEEIALKYVGLGMEVDSEVDNKTGVARSSWMSSRMAAMYALSGLKPSGKSVEEDPDGFRCLSETMKDRFERLKGCPSALVVLWNMLKRDVYHGGLQSTNVQAFSELYIPLIEKGLKIFNRMVGHNVIESEVQITPSVPSKQSKPEKGTAEEIAPPENVLLPPAFRTFVAEAAMVDLAATSVQRNALMGDPDQTSLMTMFRGILESIKYEMIILSSPASLSSKNGEIVESIVKPTLPYYYSPICNIILPNMYNSFDMQTDYHRPTRTILRSNFVQGFGAGNGGRMDVSYVAPHSVRVAISDDETLGGTLITFNNKVGRYEWGSGIRASMATVPNWLNYLQKEMGKLDEEGNPRHGSGEGSGHSKAIEAWNNAHKGYEKFNPWDTDLSSIHQWQTWGFLEADYDYMTSYAGGRRATVQTIFNPYIVVGYPMDVIDPSPMRSSYHGMCTSVTHSIHAGGSATTSVGMAACMSYEEISSTYVPSSNPWLSQHLKLDQDHRLFKNREAFELACEFYHDVLGVGAADPYILENYSTGTPMATLRQGGVWDVAPDLGDSENAPARIPYHSVLGSLSLVARNIASLPEVEKDFVDEGKTFIDISMWDIGTVVNTPRRRSSVLPESEVTGVLGVALEMGRSPFLDYPGDEEDRSAGNLPAYTEGEDS